MSLQTNSITVKRTIRAKRSLVFDAFSRSDTLFKWFSPSADISIEVLEFDFVPRGTYRIRYAMLDGSFPVVGGTYQSIKRPNQISFTWVWEEPDLHANIPTHVTIQFIENGDFTDIVLVHTQLPNKDACTRHTLGWEATLDRLNQSVHP